MKRRGLLLTLVIVLANGCADDRVELVRGPLGPANYEVRVHARGEAGERDEQHRAVLRVEPRDEERARLLLRTTGGQVLSAELRIEEDGSANLARIQGAVRSGQELASLIGQLNPPLPRTPVRIGRRWSKTQKITTKTIEALLFTELRIVRFTRMASNDAAELVGHVDGLLRITNGSRVLAGRLRGETKIVWAVAAGRVVAAETDLVWVLQDGNRVTLETDVTPR